MRRSERSGRGDTEARTPPWRREADKILPVHEAVEAYVRRALGEEDEVLRRVKAKAREVGLPSITPEAGRMLMLAAKAIGAKRAMELGTGTGYSGIWLARGLAKGGKLVTVEGSAAMAKLAREHYRAAKLAKVVTVHESDCLGAIRGAKRGSLDFVFADATKSEYPDYHDAARKALRRGGVLAADNVFWQGRVFEHDPLDGSSGGDADTAGILEFTRRIANEEEWRTAIFPFGDGLSVSVKR